MRERILLYEAWKEWEPKFSQKEIFAAIPWRDNNRDLYPGFSKSADQNKSSDEYWFDSKAAACKYASRVIDLFRSLPNPIPIFRAIKADSIEAVDLEYAGESWSFDKTSAYNFGRRNGSNFMLTAKVYKRDVNWNGTIIAYVIFTDGGGSDDDENEITVDDQDKLLDIKIFPIEKYK